MEASPIRYEVQNISTSGGSPTPLSGRFSVSFGGDSVIVNYDASASSMQSSLGRLNALVVYCYIFAVVRVIIRSSSDFTSRLLA